MSAELLRERYEPLAVAGTGGEGEVIRALDHLHGRQVALKVRRVDEPARVQMLTEARLLLSLEPHPGLPLVREDFFVDGRYVIAMDWIEGRDLEAVLTGEGDPGLDPARVLDYLEQVAEALEHLHGHDPPVVHGDVKPANMVVTSAGRVVLVDFGLSSMPDDDPRRAGTAGYVAPELAAGGRPTPASDVYSFAATALTLLTGQPPSGGQPGWGALEAERIPALERILRPNLATDPARRDRSAAAVVARLRRWWGAELPRGTVTLVLAEVAASDPEDAVEEVADAHRGHCAARVDDGPVLAAFAAAPEGLDAARELAAALDARVAVVTEEAEPRAGAYGAESTSGLIRLLDTADRGQVLVDSPTAEAVDGRLSTGMGLAELRSTVGPTGAPASVLVAPGLAVPPVAVACPYRGLMAFGPEDGDLYFGREEVVATVLGRALESGFMAVVGASGSGKSSLVRGGLVPAYRRAHEGLVAVVTPGADPAAELERALSAGAPSLLVVDQLEEVFTLCPEGEARAGFVDALLDLRETGVTAIVVTLRADFYGRCADHPRLAGAVSEHQHLLGPMGIDELRRVIESPARVGGLRLEAGLIDAVLVDVEGEPGGLPLLSHALYESWVRRDGRVLTLEGYRGAGGVRGAIANSADEVFLGCGPDERVLMRQLLLRLTELGEGTEDTRRRVPLAELAPDGQGHAEATVVLEKLASARLLVVDDDSAEIAHEALIREWPRLRGWLAEDRDELRALQQLATAARAWDESGREDADLYRGTRLEAAAELGDDVRLLAPVERAFLQSSRDVQEHELHAAQRRTRRLRALLAVVAVALVLAVIAGAFALVQRGSARHTATVAQAGRLAAQSREVAAEHPDLGLLLALEAGRLDDSVDARGALLGALEHGSRIRRWLWGFEAPVNTIVFSPDGKLLVTTTIDRTTLWDTSDWRVTGELGLAQGANEGADFAPDGLTLAIAAGEGHVELWDVARREKLRELRDPGAVPGASALAVVRYSPDGSVIAAGAMEANHVTLWNVATGRVIGRSLVTHPASQGGAHAVSFSPDSKRIAVPGASGTVGIWDVATGRRVGLPLRVGEEDVEDALFTPDGATLIAGDAGGSVTLLDVRTGRRIGRPLSVGDNPASALALSPDGRLLAAASFDGPVLVWDTSTGLSYGAPLVAGTTPPSDIAFGPDGRTLVSGHVGSAVAWSLGGDQVIGEPLDGLADLTTDVSFSPDGTSLLAGRLDGGTVVYDTATRRQTLRIDGGSPVTAVAYRPDGDLVAVGTIGGRVRFLDPASGAAVGSPLVWSGSAVWQVAFSPDGRLLAVAVDPNGGGEGFYAQQRQGEVQLWDVESRERVGRAIRPGAGSVMGMAFSSDGGLLATGSGGRLDLWDVKTQAAHGKPMLVPDDGVPSVVFHPRGRLVVGGGAIGPVRVWRVDEQAAAFPPLAGHTGPVTAIAFDEADAFLATTSVHGASRLWEPATGLAFGEELTPSPRLGNPADALALPAFLALGSDVSPDGSLLAVAGVESHAMVWSVDPAVWRERACAVVGRNLTPEEWSLYLPRGTTYRTTCSEWPAG